MGSHFRGGDSWSSDELNDLLENLNETQLETLNIYTNECVLDPTVRAGTRPGYLITRPTIINKASCSNQALMNRILFETPQPGYPKRDPRTGEVLPLDKHGNPIMSKRYQPPKQGNIPVTGLLTTDMIRPTKTSQGKTRSKWRSCLKRFWRFCKGGSRN